MRSQRRHTRKRVGGAPQKLWPKANAPLASPGIQLALPPGLGGTCMRWVRWVRLAALAPLCVASVAAAHDEQSGSAEPHPPVQYVQKPSYEGLYVGLGGHFGLENFDLPSAFEIDDSGGLNARVGYRTSDTLAAELVFDWVAPFEVRAQGAKVGEIEMALIAFNLKIFPWEGPIQPFVQAGIGMLIVERDTLGFSETNFPAAGRFGVGVDLHLARRSRALGTEAVYVPPFGDATDELDFVSDRRESRAAILSRGAFR